MADYTKKKKELSVQSPSVHPTNNTPASSSHSKFHVNRRHVTYLCACCTGITAILSLVILILSFTLFKVRDPTLTLNSITVDDFRINTSMSQKNLVSANVTLVSDISIKNPNMVSFKFSRTLTEFYYKGGTLGVAYAPAGQLGARKDTRLNVTMDVVANRIVEDNINVIENIFLHGEVDLTSYTSVKGRVSVFGLYKKDMEVGLNCSVVLGLSIINVEIKSTACQASDLKE
ncbi:Late embryogenesis abundant protein [Carex littledalei]|uniref:Late embryogenesis abundant protein n=1 Tax=Carex littledalei TaxID=544730 RepID=A0A833QRY4_9POAL|nr:Late embryogenesis abundant protein [Carex littledalei]